MTTDSEAKQLFVDYLQPILSDFSDEQLVAAEKIAVTIIRFHPHSHEASRVGLEGHCAVLLEQSRRRGLK